MNNRNLPIRNPKVKIRQEAFGKLLVLAGLPMLCINEDGARIWDMCNGERTVAQIVTECASATKSENLTAINEAVCEFLDEAFRLGLINLETDQA